MKEQLRQLPWKLIFILALIQLTRPILSTAGFFDDFRPQGPIIATALIALIWIGVAVVGNVREPVKVLAMAGATYAVIGVAMAVFLQTFFTWSPEETVSIPLLLTAGLIGSIVTNVIWGAFFGIRGYWNQESCKKIIPIELRNLVRPRRPVGSTQVSRRTC